MPVPNEHDCGGCPVWDGYNCLKDLDELCSVVIWEG